MRRTLSWMTALCLIALALMGAPISAREDSDRASGIEVELVDFLDVAGPYLEERYAGAWLSPDIPEMNIGVKDLRPGDHNYLSRHLPEGAFLKLVPATYSEQEILNFLQRAVRTVRGSPQEESFRAAGPSFEDNAVVVEVSGHPRELISSLEAAIPPDALEIRTHSNFITRFLGGSPATSALPALLTLIVLMAFIGGGLYSLKRRQPSKPETSWGLSE